MDLLEIEKKAQQQCHSECVPQISSVPIIWEPIRSTYLWSLYWFSWIWTWGGEGRVGRLKSLNFTGALVIANSSRLSLNSTALQVKTWTKKKKKNIYRIPFVGNQKSNWFASSNNNSFIFGSFKIWKFLGGHLICIIFFPTNLI